MAQSFQLTNVWKISSMVGMAGRINETHVGTQHTTLVRIASVMNVLECIFILFRSTTDHIPALLSSHKILSLTKEVLDLVKDLQVIEMYLAEVSQKPWGMTRLQRIHPRKEG